MVCCNDLATCRNLDRLLRRPEQGGTRQLRRPGEEGVQQSLLESLTPAHRVRDAEELTEHHSHVLGGELENRGMAGDAALDILPAAHAGHFPGGGWCAGQACDLGGHRGERRSHVVQVEAERRVDAYSEAGRGRAVLRSRDRLVAGRRVQRRDLPAATATAIPAMNMNNAPKICGALPIPADAIVTLPGLALA